MVCSKYIFLIFSIYYSILDFSFWYQTVYIRVNFFIRLSQAFSQRGSWTSALRRLFGALTIEGRFELSVRSNITDPKLGPLFLLSPCYFVVVFFTLRCRIRKEKRERATRLSHDCVCSVTRSVTSAQKDGSDATHSQKIHGRYALWFVSTRSRDDKRGTSTCRDSRSFDVPDFFVSIWHHRAEFQKLFFRASPGANLISCTLKASATQFGLGRPKKKQKKNMENVKYSPRPCFWTRRAVLQYASFLMPCWALIHQKSSAYLRSSVHALQDAGP